MSMEGAPEPSGKAVPVPSWEEVSLDDIDKDDESFRLRFSPTCSDLRASMVREGQRTPINLTGRKPFRVIDGFRRLAAARALGWTEIKAYVHHGITDGAAIRLALSNNLVRRSLSKLEKAAGFQAALALGIPVVDLAQTVGLSEKQIKRYIELLSLPGPIKRMVESKTISMAHAKVLADYAVEDLEEWQRRIRHEQLNVRSLRRLVARAAGRRIIRKKLYIRVEQQQVRVFPFVIRREMPTAERDRLARLLRQALEFVESTVDETRVPVAHGSSKVRLVAD